MLASLTSSVHHVGARQAAPHVVEGVVVVEVVLDSPLLRRVSAAHKQCASCRSMTSSTLCGRGRGRGRGVLALLHHVRAQPAAAHVVGGGVMVEA